MKPISGNDVLDEAEDNSPADLWDLQIFNVWKEMIEQTVERHGKTMDDNIFVMNEDGTHYDVVVDKKRESADDAYDRAMRGI